MSNVTTDNAMWGIHMALAHGRAPLDEGYVALGWAEIGDLSRVRPSRDAFKAAYSGAYPQAKLGNVAVSAGVLFRFINEIKVGDVIVYPSKVDRTVNIGIVSGSYRFGPGLPGSCAHVRAVNWQQAIPRAEFSQPALNEIGSAISLFRVNINGEEFLAALEGKALEPGDIDDVSAAPAVEQAQEATGDFIIKRLKFAQTATQFEHFIAHLLRCMGYHARVTQASGDGGVDIIAHRDELGFEPPIIKVQCKQVLATIGRPEVQQLHGAIERGEHGLFVTLGNYSADARTFERTKPNLRLIDGEALIELIYTHYERFEPRYRTLLPLTRSYSPDLAEAP